MNESSSSTSGQGALAEFKQAITNLFEQVVGLAPDLGLGREFPRHELRVEDDGYRARLELPGVRRERVDVSIAGRNLTVSGERPRFEPPAGARMLRRERPSGKFSVTVRLPGEVDALGVTARMRDGVLEVWLPKPGPRGRSIEVELADEGPAEPERAGPEPERTTPGPEATAPERERAGPERERATSEPESTAGREPGRPDAGPGGAGPDIPGPETGRRSPPRMPWEDDAAVFRRDDEQERDR